MLRWVEFLADEIGPRPYRSPKLLRRVAEKLASQFRALGYQIEEQPFYFRGEIYYNVVALPPAGAVGVRRSLVVVGAHYDTVPGSPGADDNASGVAGLIELARLLADSPPPSVRLVAFGLEEPPVFRTRHMGSYAYAQRLRGERVKIKGMICLEMIGNFSDRPKSQSFPLFFMDSIYPETGNFIALVGNTRSRPWTKAVKAAFSKGTDLPVESLSAPFVVIGVDFSDHWSFYRHGYQAVMVTDTAFYRNPHYHRPSDLPRTLDYVRAAKVVDGVAAAVRALA